MSPVPRMSWQVRSGRAPARCAFLFPHLSAGRTQLRVIDPRPEPQHPSAGKLQLDIVARGELRGVRPHRRGPGRDHPRVRNVNQDGKLPFRLGLRAGRVVEKRPDRVGRPCAEPCDPTVAREPCGVANQPAEARMVRVLVLDETRRKDDPGPHAPYDRRQLERVGGLGSRLASPSSVTNSEVAEEPCRPSRLPDLAAGVPCVADSPREQMTKCARLPAWVSRAMTPPHPNSMSSGGRQMPAAAQVQALISQ